MKEDTGFATSSTAHQDAAETPTRKPYLKIQALTKMFGDFTALRDVSLDIMAGEFICFLGPSGCGKTTLLRAIAGLDIQTSGRIWQDGRDISELPAAERDFGIVFQSYALFPNLNVARNVGYGLVNRKLARARINARVAELLDLVGLPDQGDKYPGQLSGGQQQRVALARALATSPGLLLLDEPLSALDAKVRTYLRHEIKTLQRRLKVTTIMVTHDQEEALTMADRIVLINRGVIEQVGTPTEIYREPATLFGADFIGTMNQVPCQVASRSAAKIGAHTIACRPNDLPENSRAILTIRPEDIVPSLDRSPVGGKGGDGEAEALSGTSLDVSVGDMEFLGSFWRAQLHSHELADAELEADFSVNAVQRMGLGPGRSIRITLPKSRVMLFPDPDV